MLRTLQFDYVIIGSGLAGSTAAYVLSPTGEVALVSKGSPNQSNSFAAQGGIAAAIGADDSAHFHGKDTLATGQGLSDPDTVRHLTERAPNVIRWMVDIGVPFDRTSTGDVSLGLEGAHSRRRILHAGGDATGRKIMETVTEALRGTRNVHRIERNVISLVKDSSGYVSGALTSAPGDEESRCLLLARKATILATGGAGQLYRSTTNPLGATGDGIALAHRAGAVVRNLEFVQFHPTSLHVPGTNPQFLISEAVRGAGARLVDEAATPIMAWHPLADLAPRDIVARTIYQHMQNHHQVYLDCRNISDFESHFPTIYRGCMRHGLNPSFDLLPVSPAAHFMMGGVAAAITGETSLPGLYAIGEVANTGVHGANRLASNSLLECAVMAFELANHLALRGQHWESLPPYSSDEVDSSVGTRAIDFLENQTVWVSEPFVEDTSEILSTVRELMWNCTGIVRDAESMRQGLAQLTDLHVQYPNSAAIYTATLILQSALCREESRGAHYRSDFPETNPAYDQRPTILVKATGGSLSGRNEELSVRCTPESGLHLQEV